MKKWWKELIDKPLLKAFLHYYQASDSGVDQCRSSLLLVDFDFPPAFGGGQYPPLFSDSCGRIFGLYERRPAPKPL